MVPDFNGDGLADVAIGSPAAGSQYVAIFNGSPFGPGFTPDVTLTDGALFGRAVASAGDINGDGFIDLAVASGPAPGAVTVYLGGPAGPGGAGTALSAGDVTSGFGDTMASAGDVNGDGYGDLLVGGLEHAQVFLGSSGGLATTAALTLVGSTANGSSGEATVVQGPSDVNADGAPDLFVGNALYLSSPGGLNAQADFSIFLPGSFAGDENGDGFGDFASEQVSPGTPDGVDTRQFLFVQAGESTMGTAGDVNGDGYSDIISSLSAIENFGDRQRVYFGAPGSCGSTGAAAICQFRSRDTTSWAATSPPFWAALATRPATVSTTWWPPHRRMGAPTSSAAKRRGRRRRSTSRAGSSRRDSASPSRRCFGTVRPLF